MGNICCTKRGEKEVKMMEVVVKYRCGDCNEQVEKQVCCDFCYPYQFLL